MRSNRRFLSSKGKYSFSHRRQPWGPIFGYRYLAYSWGVFFIYGYYLLVNDYTFFSSHYTYYMLRFSQNSSKTLIATLVFMLCNAVALHYIAICPHQKLWIWMRLVDCSNEIHTYWVFFSAFYSIVCGRIEGRRPEYFFNLCIISLVIL